MKYTRIMLHRWLLGVEDRDVVVDHINHNTLDNRRSNLRITDKVINGLNRKGANSNSRSGVRGVYWHQKDKKWRARVKLHGKAIWQSSFDNFDDAVCSIEQVRMRLMTEMLEAKNNDIS